MTSIQETSQETSVSSGLVGWIIEVDGEVLLKRKGWSNYQPTTVGAELYPGDLLQPATRARVLVQCANGKTIWHVPDGMVSGATNGCPPQTVFVPRARGDLIPPRGGINPLIPYIISPRRTLVLNPLPTLKWNVVPGASRYTLSLLADEDVIWQTQLRETLAVYPGEPPLESDVDYLLMIEANTGASSQEENLPDLGFGLLGENEAQRVSEGVVQLVNLDLAQEAKSLALVHLYSGYELKAEAIATLEALLNKGSQTAAVYRILGDLYLEIGLNLLAESRYLRAIELAAADVEGQALAAASLAKVYEAIANTQEVIHWLTQARNRYQILGDRQRLGELEKRRRLGIN